MVAEKLTVYAYQELLDVGWRRSGTYVYRPDPCGSCCPAYTIRLDATQFNATPAQRRVLRRFEAFCSGDWARRQRTRQQQQSGLDPIQGPPPSTSTLDAAPTTGEPPQTATQVDAEAVAEQISKRCSEAFTRHLPASIAPAVASAIRNADQIFTLKKQPTATPGSDKGDVQTMCIQSAVCWKAAAQSTSAAAPGRVSSPPPLPNRSPAASSPLSPTLPMSKNKAKKARKAAARAAAAGGATRGPPVSAVATQLAQAVLPAVQSMLAADAVIAPLTPAATADRGHLHVTLHVPASVPGAAGPELQALLQHKRPPAPDPAAAANVERCLSAMDTGSAADTAPAPEPNGAHASGGDQLDESIDSDADWSPHSSEAGSDGRASEGDAPGEARTQWWLEDPPEGGWQLRTVLRPSGFVQEEYQLYQRYQRRVHGDPPGKASRSGYERFLVDTPWEGTVPRSQDSDAPDCGYGAFHMQFWLGDHLIAVGVWDILPRCLSSKYLIWDPDLPFLSLGKWTALQEVEWVRAAHAAGASTLRYAYLGLYIHSNQKMRYKAEFQPSDLLCRQTLSWVPCSPKLRRALDTEDGTAALCDLEQPHPDPPPAIPPATLPGGPYLAIPELPPMFNASRFVGGDVLVHTRGTLARMRRWVAGVGTQRAAAQLQRIAAEVVTNMGPRAASQICLVFD